LTGFFGCKRKGEKMEDIAVIFLVVLVIIVVGGLWLLFVFMSCIEVYIYKISTKIKAVVIEDLGKLNKSTGHISLGVPKFRTFQRYKVSINIDGQQMEVETELKKRNLKAGDTIVVRYYVGKKDNIELASQADLYWSLEMAIGYTLGIIFGIVLWITMR